MPSPPPITVVISRFDDLLALGLDSVMADESTMTVLARDVAIDRVGVVLQAHRPDVLLLDVDALPELARVRTLCLAHPATRLVLLGEPRGTAEAAQLLAVGASACLSRTTQARDVRHAVHLASRGMQLMPLGAASAAGERAAAALLTHREGDVLALLRQGQSNAQIALALQIGVETVRSHARSIFRKLGVSSRRALIALATPQPVAPAPPAAHPARRRPVARDTARRPRHP